MKRLIQIIIVCLLLSGCTSQVPKENAKLNVLCPTGAPTLAFLESYENITSNGKFDITEGTDQLVAELAKKDSDYDVIVAPVNLGMNLISKGKSSYKIQGVITWGNLYVVGTPEAINESEDILLFGEGAVPEKIYEQCAIENLNPIYMSDASLVSADLASGKANIGLLAEPLASATIAKAKKQNVDLEILVDLQKEYALKHDKTNGYPQAAIFVKEGVNISSLEKELENYTKDMSNAESYLEKIGVETLGLPDANIVLKSLERQNVHYKKAKDVKDDLSEFLSLFNITIDETMFHD